MAYTLTDDARLGEFRRWGDTCTGLIFQFLLKTNSHRQLIRTVRDAEFLLFLFVTFPSVIFCAAGPPPQCIRSRDRSCRRKKSCKEPIDKKYVFGNSSLSTSSTAKRINHSRRPALL